MSRIKNIKRVEDSIQQCISLNSKEGLYLTDEKIITHNSPATVK